MVMVLDQLIGNYNMQFIVNIAELIVIWRNTKKALQS